MLQDKEEKILVSEIVNKLCKYIEKNNGRSSSKK